MKSHGFTLIELLIVVAILGIIASIAISAGRGLIAEREARAEVHRAPQTTTVVSPECRNGYLMNGAQAITDKNGAVVKC